MRKDTSNQSPISSPAVARLGLLAGPLFAAASYALLPDEYRDATGKLVEFHTAGRATLAAMIWMGTWWLTEAIPIYATALLPLAVFPLLGIADMKAASAPYANPLIFLFMGGFLLALSMEKWGLGKRIALTILRMVGTRPVNMIAGFMFTTAVLSAFVSNTATTAMMLPIAISVIRLVKTQSEPDGSGKIGQKGESDNFAICLMILSLATGLQTRPQNEPNAT